MYKEKSINKRENKSAVRFFAVCMIILMVCSVVIWGLQSNWGNVKIKRIYLTGQDGTTISSLVYVPKNATDETPAPAAVILHGRSNQGHSNDTWSMELARRGYVVFSPDLSGGGESDVNDRAAQAVTVAEYANSQSYIIKDALNLVGYSFGTQTCLDVYGAIPESVNSITEVFGPYRLKNAGGIDNINTNIGLLKASADQYDYWFIGRCCNRSYSQ